jgi:hypothetical protein
MLAQALLCWRVMMANTNRREQRTVSAYDFTPVDLGVFTRRTERLRSTTLPCPASPADGPGSSRLPAEDATRAA